MICAAATPKEIPNAFLFTKHSAGETYPTGCAKGSTHSSRRHLRFAGFPAAVERFMEKCAGVQRIEMVVHLQQSSETEEAWNI